MGQLTAITFTLLRQIAHPKGDIYHALRKSEPEFSDFGEAYFTFIKGGETKGWKKHTKMTMNLVVPVGEVRFHMLDSGSGQLQVFTLGTANYGRLTVPPGYWTAFTGMTAGLNLILNIADIAHDPNESENTPVHTFELNTG